MGITRYLKNASANRVTVIPNFINTPLDVLALGLFDLLAPLALKVAEIDGRVPDSERKLVTAYFIKEWGYDAKFVDEGINYTESKLGEISIRELAQALVRFTRENPDCNFKMMSREILGFLRNIVEAGGRIDEYEEVTLAKIETIFDSAHESSIKRSLRGSWRLIKQKTAGIFARNNSVKGD